MLKDLFFMDDLTEIWIKLNQRGLKFIMSKFSFISNVRTISSFADNFEHANWWIIPYIKRRRNFQITGHYEIEYEQYVTEKYFKNAKKQSSLISLGCGEGSHELMVAKLNPNINIRGYDISRSLIDKANKNAHIENLTNITFNGSDVYDLTFKDESVDYFLFNASLHHFKAIKTFIETKIKPSLKQGGLIIIHEYVGPNRLNLPKEQISYCNECLHNVISIRNRKILGTNKYKNRCYRLGKIRMLISDPSECIDSESIIPVLRNEFKEVEFKNLGGNILMPVLKHIAHHFIENNAHELMELIKLEDEYLTNHSSDQVFAIYQKM